MAIDQMNNSSLRTDANPAVSNWNNYPGPQYISWTQSGTQSYVYFKTWTNLPNFPNMLEQNCNSNGCPTTSGSIVWSNIFADPNDLQCSAQIVTHLFAHEIGHAYLLAHHGNANSLMSQGSSGGTCNWVGNLAAGPGTIELGPLPPCSSGDQTNLGLRCIYNFPS